jgi:Glycosyl hydrolases family 28
MNFNRINFSIKTLLALALLALPSVIWAKGGTFNVKKYGAVGDGVKMETPALQAAIDAAAKEGGGTVVLPAGKYLSGSIYLKSHVTLQLDEGATLLGSTSRMDYQEVSFYALLLAYKQEDIKICGKGTIDGQGKALADDARRLFKEGKIPDALEHQRPLIFSFVACTGVTVQDITLRDSSCWVQLYRNCDKVTVERVTVRSHGAINNDGIDIDGSRNVVLRNLDIDSEDDGICLKSGDQPCDNVLVENSRVRSSCNGLKFGTSSVGGFKNIICRNIEVYDTYLSGIGLMIVDGGVMENVSISNIKITDTHNPIFIRLGNRKGEVGRFNNVVLSDIKADIPNRTGDQITKLMVNEGEIVTENFEKWRPTLTPVSITGIPGHPIQGITLKNVTINYGGIGNTAKRNHLRWDSLAKIPECIKNYPESKMFGILPSWGFFIRHAEGIKFENITVTVKDKDYRPAVVCDDVQKIDFKDFRILSAGTEPVIVLNDVKGATFQNCPPPSGTSTFVKTTGKTSEIKKP